MGKNVELRCFKDLGCMCIVYDFLSGLRTKMTRKCRVRSKFYILAVSTHFVLRMVLLIGEQPVITHFLSLVLNLWQMLAFKVG